MPQGQISRPSAVVGATKRKQVPKVQKRSGSEYEKHNHKISSAIIRKIEELMAGRLAHEGGKLAIIPKPDNIDGFVKSASRLGTLAVTDLKKSTKARMGRKAREEGNEKKQSDKDLEKELKTGSSSSKKRSNEEMNSSNNNPNGKKNNNSSAPNNRSTKNNNNNNDPYNELGIKIASEPGFFEDEDEIKYDEESTNGNRNKAKRQKQSASKKTESVSDEDEDDEEESDKEASLSAVGSWFPSAVKTVSKVSKKK